jgi:cytochrome c oxidase subunit IV
MVLPVTFEHKPNIQAPKNTTKFSLTLSFLLFLIKSLSKLKKYVTIDAYWFYFKVWIFSIFKTRFVNSLNLKT